MLDLLLDGIDPTFPVAMNRCEKLAYINARASSLMLPPTFLNSPASIVLSWEDFENITAVEVGIVYLSSLLLLRFLDSSR